MEQKVVYLRWDADFADFQALHGRFTSQSHGWLMFIYGKIHPSTRMHGTLAHLKKYTLLHDDWFWYILMIGIIYLKFIYALRDGLLTPLKTIWHPLEGPGIYIYLYWNKTSPYQSHESCEETFHEHSTRSSILQNSRSGCQKKTGELGHIWIWVFPKIGVGPHNGLFIWENPIRIDDLGVSLFLETPISSEEKLNKQS